MARLWAQVLYLPLGDHNALVIAAGYAPVTAKPDWRRQRWLKRDGR
jgi:hypothetical protein